MTVQDSLASVLQQYEQVLDKLETTGPPTEAIILSVLTTRDLLQTALAGDAAVTDAIRLKIFQLDQRLRQQAEAIARGIPLTTWRDSVSPPSTAWWWHFPEVVDPRDRLDWIWDALTLTTMTANISLIMNISSKFLTGGLDFWGAFAVVSQSVLALLTGGGVLTESGRRSVDTVLQSLGVTRYRWNETKFGMAMSLFLVLLGLHGSLPQIARFYARQGEQQQAQGNLTSAQDRLKRSLQLNPNDARVNYDLGKLYGSLGQTAEAETALQLAARGGVEPAFVELAQLYNRQDQPLEAIAILRQLRAQQGAPGANPDTPAASPEQMAKAQELAYGYHTNLGWALLKQGRWQAAEAELKVAMELFPRRAAPHCLMAQVLERQNLDARDEWQRCQDLANMTIPEEDNWSGLAESRLQAADQPIPPNLLPLPTLTP